MRFLIKTLLWGADGKASKSRMFIRIMALLAFLGLFISFITKITFISTDESKNLRVAVVGPMSGNSQIIGRSLRQGVQLYVDALNESGGVDGKKISLDVVDDKDDA